MDTIESIREIFRDKFQRKAFADNGTLEIIACQFIANEPSIFGSPDCGYIAREMQWYESQSTNVTKMIPPIPRIWQKISSPHGQVNSNYGNLIYSTACGSQYQKCLQELNRNTETRRAVMIYLNPHMHDMAIQNGMNDFVCTYAVQFLIRERQLYCLVNMRSSDAIFGYKNDRHWHHYIHRQLLDDLKQKSINQDIELGPIIWNAGSFHMYPQHFKLIT